MTKIDSCKTLRKCFVYRIQIQRANSVYLDKVVQFEPHNLDQSNYCTLIPENKANFDITELHIYQNFEA